MDENLQPVVAALADRFGSSHTEFRGQTTVFLRPDGGHLATAGYDTATRSEVGTTT